MRELDDFTKGYIAAALGVETFDDRPNCDEDRSYQDMGYDADSIADASMDQIIADCQKFQADNQHLWEGKTTGHEWSIEEAAGHDFWLTRNGHGVGFWDREEIWGENKDTLSDAADSYNELHLYWDGSQIIFG